MVSYWLSADLNGKCRSERAAWWGAGMLQELADVTWSANEQMNCEPDADSVSKASISLTQRVRQWHNVET